MFEYPGRSDELASATAWPAGALPQWLVKARAVWRLLRAVSHLLLGAWKMLICFPFWSAAERQDRIQCWSHRLLDCLGVALQLRGQALAGGPLLLVANHVSWLDIASIHAVGYCRFVAKANVRQWPLIGFLAEGTGTLFVQRESPRDASRVVQQMVQSLRQGEVVALFAEGTTSDGTGVLPFRGGLLQAAIAVDCPIQALALKFIDSATGAHSAAACYVGQDTLLLSLWRIVCASGLTVQITLGPTQCVAGRDRRTLALELGQQVAALRRTEPVGAGRAVGAC